MSARCNAKLRNRSRNFASAVSVGNSEQVARFLRTANCRNVVSEEGQRCRLHGGASTGPKTVEGKLKVSLNLPCVRLRRTALG